MPTISTGLKTSLNAIREISSDIYHRYIPIIDDNTDIGTFGQPILTVPVVMNEFVSQLVNRIAYVQFTTKYFNNPLQMLEGDNIPLGYAGEEIFINPAKGRKYNVNDFAGLLVKYEADVKVQYTSVNMDLQYPVTVNRTKLKQAFVSWDALESFIGQISQSLYNGAYIDEYNFTKNLVSGAYKSNQAQIKVVSGITNEETAKAFIEEARTLFLNFQTPMDSFNAWKKLDGQGRAITTFCNPEDIVFLVRSDIYSKINVEVLASAFNVDKSTLLGNIISVNNFDQFDEDGEKIFDGSKILGLIADKSWFRIKRQDMFLDEFYNPNNRTWQYYLNLIKMYNYSLFANAVIFATEAPTVALTEMSFKETAPAVTATEEIILHLAVTPVSATTPVTFTSGTVGKATVEKIDDRTVKVTGVASGTSVITATAGSVTTNVTVTVNA